ncbi:hypothetical protein B0O80DRAFT_496007 [Mortierella sp. GBAus27b]|nr:hypothetical protein B0O80DRAFT_496007 [Mortierella sp. GBAus27b]
MRILSVITSLLFLVVIAAQVTFTNCATSPTDFQVSGFKVSPVPMCVNQTLCATGTGTFSAPIVHGTNLTKFSLIGRYLGLILYKDERNLCELLAAQGQPCPIPVGTTSLTTCVVIKDNLPTGIPYKMEFRLTNGNGNPIYCMNATMTAQRC